MEDKNASGQELKKTCLYDKHCALNATMSPFGGFIMPIQYSSIKKEHEAVRDNVGMFDVSHMGEILVKGPDALAYVNYIFSNDISELKEGETIYGMLLYPDGGVVDDLLIYKSYAEDEYMLVVNAANTDKDFAWMKKHIAEYDVQVLNESSKWGQLAVQGPNAVAKVADLLHLERVAELPVFGFKNFDYSGERIVISRTGYTGEDGVEIYAPEALIVKFWDMFLEVGVEPCGLGCRDTLRFEAGMPLYGHELSDKITPVMAGFGFFCKVDKKDFIGRDALADQKENGFDQKLVGIELEDKAVPREGYEVETPEGEVVGIVTTGYRSITLEKSICFALVKKEYSKLGTELAVRVRRKVHPGKVVKKRFLA